MNQRKTQHESDCPEGEQAKQGYGSKKTQKRFTPLPSRNPACKRRPCQPSAAVIQSSQPKPAPYAPWQDDGLESFPQDCENHYRTEDERHHFEERLVFGIRIIRKTIEPTLAGFR